MTPTETVLLTRYVRACCPQQHIDEYTPDAWHELLGDLDADSCRAAVAAIARRQPFVAPAEIRAEIRRARRDRLDRDPVPAPSHDLADDPGRYRKELQSRIREIADGRTVLKAIGPLPSQDPSSIEELRAQLGPAAPTPERLLPPEEVARRQVAESRASRDAS